MFAIYVLGYIHWISQDVNTCISHLSNGKSKDYVRGLKLIWGMGWQVVLMILGILAVSHALENYAVTLHIIPD